MEIFSIASSLVQHPDQDLTHFFFLMSWKKYTCICNINVIEKGRPTYKNDAHHPTPTPNFDHELRVRQGPDFPLGISKLPHAPSSLPRLKRKNISKLLLSTFRTPSSKLHIPSTGLQSSPLTPHLSALLLFSLFFPFWI